MFAWFRKIRRINIFGFELEFDHSAGELEGPGRVKTPDPPIRNRRIRRAPAGGSPASITVHGEVVGTIGKDLGIRIMNEDEVREFWRVNRLTTKLDWAGKGPPVFSIGRKQDYESCMPGDEASMTVEVVQRANGERGSRTIAFEVLRKGETDGDNQG